MTEQHEPNPYPRRKWVEYGALPAAILFWVCVFLFAPRLPPRHGRRSRCVSNLKQITLGCALYSGDYNGAFPADLVALYPTYVSDAALFICAKTRAPVQAWRRSSPGAISDMNLSICYVSGLTAMDDPGYVLAFEEEWNHEGKGVNVAYIGGGVAWQKGLGPLHMQLAKQAAELKAKGRTMKVIRPAWSTWPARPPWVAEPPRSWWVVGGSCAGVLVIAFATMIFILRRRRKRRSVTEAEAEHA